MCIIKSVHILFRLGIVVTRSSESDGRSDVTDRFRLP